MNYRMVLGFRTGVCIVETTRSRSCRAVENINTWTMFALTTEDGWRFGIGDPTVMGWLTVGGYWLAAVLCWRAAVLAKRMQVSRATHGWSDTAIFWVLCGSFLMALGVNKQLDLQTWFTLTTKQMALRQGWYEQRRLFQAVFIGLVGLSGVAALILMNWLRRSSRQQTQLAFFGGVFLTCFVLIRASSFHHVDQMLGFRFGGLKMNWIFEIGGICCVAISAWRARRLAKTFED